MPTIEKHNGLWFEDESSGQLVFEEYAADLDLIGAVYKKEVNFFVSALYSKVSDYQFTMPFWSQVRPEAFFDNQQEAITHVLALLERNRKEA